MAKKKTSKKQSKKQEDSKLYAFLATFLSIIGFIIAIIVKKDDKYVMYYAKQSLVIFIMSVVVGIVVAFIGWIPIIGWLIALALNVLVFIVWLMSWINALSGKQKEIKIVSNWAKKINL